MKHEAASSGNDGGSQTAAAAAAATHKGVFSEHQRDRDFSCTVEVKGSARTLITSALHWEGYCAKTYASANNISSE